MRRIKLSLVCICAFLILFSSTSLALGQPPGYTIFLPLVIAPPGPCSTAPTLISPTNGGISNTLLPTFRWENGDVKAVTEVHFVLTLEQDDFPNDWVYWTTSNNSNFEEQQYRTSNLTPGTTYYWQVWLGCSGTESPHSTLWSFTTSADGMILPAPVLTSPSNEMVIYVSMLPLTLQWLPVDGAQEYKVVISRWADGTWYSHWVAYTNEPQFTIPFIMTQNTWHKWTVTPINDYAIGSPASRTFKTYY